MKGYAAVWAVPAARTVLVLGMTLRLPHFGASLLMTVHVVNLTGSYGLGGIVTAVWTLSSTLANIYRGRMLDRHGLRRTLIPSLIVLPLAWLIVPWVGFTWLVPLAALLGLFQMPISSVVRSGLAANLPPAELRRGFALDSVLIETMFIAGPALALTLGTMFDSGWTLAGLGLIGAIATAALAVLDPPLRAEGADAGAAPPGWLNRRVIGVLIVTFATLFLLGASDVTIIAATRDLGTERLLAVVMVLWGGGSAVGGFIYGSLSRPLHPAVALVVLTVLFALSASSPSLVWLCILLFIAGLACAPTLTTTVEALSGLTPASVRGTMFGIHSALITAGIAAGAPAAGVVVDALRWRGAVIAVSLAALVIAGLGGVLLRRLPEPEPTITT